MPPPKSKSTRQALKPGSDVRFKDLSAVTAVSKSTIQSLWFNQDTVWAPNVAPIAQNVLTAGMNPGLGVHLLHAQSITGAGVSVGIIDQNMLLGHPEYSSSVVQYCDFGCNQVEGSMHGPAVASLLVGKQIGTAPGAKLYFAAAPSWLEEAKFYADALNWLLAINAKLPPAEKIRVISVSAAPSGPGSSFKDNKGKKMWDLGCASAEQKGVLVLDCTQTRWDIGRCYYDPDDPENLSKVTPGAPGEKLSEISSRTLILAPSSRRTQAEEYQPGKHSYQYTGIGGLSWSIPYIAGVLALGWQVNPTLSGKEMMKLLGKAAFTQNGVRIINPPAFIASVQVSTTP